MELVSVMERQKGLRIRPGPGLPRRDSGGHSGRMLGGGAPT
jgi:hypothetical protein